MKSNKKKHTFDHDEIYINHKKMGDERKHVDHNNYHEIVLIITFFWTH